MEKERELELRERLDQQRRVLEGKYKEALQGEDGGDVRGSSSCPSCCAHLGLPQGPSPPSGPQVDSYSKAGVYRILGLRAMIEFSFGHDCVCVCMTRSCCIA
jgi:hypothetical protein